MSKGEEEVKLWDPTLLFDSSTSQSCFAIIVLNQPIVSAHKEIVKLLWERATLRICADGGANRLFEAYGENITYPHEIRGDLDSLRDDVRDFYSAKEVEIVKVSSQYATDLQKCVLRVEEFEEERAKKDDGKEDGEMEIVVLGGLSGRLDQTMHTLHVLCQMTQSDSQDGKKYYARAGSKKKVLGEEDFAVLDRREKTWVLSENSLVWILGEGSHIIKIDRNRFGPTCGLMPFVSQIRAESKGTRIWTEGLEWDLDGTPSAVGGFLSTSNHLKEDQVRVTTDGEIIWTMEVRED